MEHEINDHLTHTMDRLAAAASLLQQAAERIADRESSFAIEAEATIGHIVATVDNRREAELEQKLAAAEAQLVAKDAQLAELRASATATVTNGRKTLPTATATLLAKQGVAGDSVASLEAGALDAALVSLSLEQRIAVKAQLLRAGLLS